MRYSARRLQGLRTTSTTGTILRILLGVKGGRGGAVRGVQEHVQGARGCDAHDEHIRTQAAPREVRAHVYLKGSGRGEDHDPLGRDADDSREPILHTRRRRC